MSTKTALVHIGTHKTGTTSLQLFFDANQDPFRAAGVRITQGGRYQHLPGNHQVAWELLGTNDSPHAAELFAELRGLGERTALITSEDLCLLYARPESLDYLRDGIASAGYVPKIVVYLRAQAPYAESMYVERIKHDYLRPLGGYVETILRDGLYIPDGSPIHLEFQYTRLLEPFVRTFGRENVILRPYVASADPLHIFRDFLAVLGSVDPVFSSTGLKLTVPQARANESLTYWGLLLQAYRACGFTGGIGELADDVRALAPAISNDLLQARVRLMQRDEHLLFSDAFGADNARLMDEFSITLDGATSGDVAPEEDARWGIARAQRELFDHLMERWTTRKAAGQPLRE